MKLDHIGIAVRDLDEASRFYARAFGLKETRREEVPARGVRVAFLGDPADPEGCKVELLEPAGEGGAIAKFLAKRGPGVHHLTFRTEDIASDMERLRKMDRPPIEEKPRSGACGHKVCFVHPKHTGGVLVELAQHSDVKEP